MHGFARTHRSAGLSDSPALPAPATADVKIAFIDPLSGGAASTGILAQKTHQFYIDAINAAGGLNGEKLELLSYDNKVNPQESLIQLKRALDEGARYVVQGNGSSVALAITDAVQKHNERNPGKEVLFLNYAAVDPALTNDKCNFWHFRFDADADMKMAALTDVIAKDKKVQKRLPDQPGLFVRQGGRGGGEQDARREAPRHQDRRRRAASAAESQRLLALRRQDQGGGRRHGDHRQLEQRHGAADQGRQGRGPQGGPGTPTTAAARAR